MQLKSICTLYFILWIIILGILLQYANSEPQVPCYFVLGDSLSDNGNNNDLPTMAKVNYPPYGIDFPGSISTGRFSNGLNIIDVIGMHLGLNESVPPFASIGIKSGEELSRGVNYASGAAGIRAETGIHLGARISIDQQLVNHESVMARIALALGMDTFAHLNKCLYTINVGSNDYLNNYFLPEKNYYSSKLYNLRQYAKVLIEQYSRQLQMLYVMGARKVAVFKLGPIGCTPQAISKFGFLGILCSTKVNIAVAHFNIGLQNLVDELNKKLIGANITCINLDEIFITSCPGFLHITTECCKVRAEDGQCQNDSVPCPHRKSYVFYDNFHPTEAFNIRTGARAYRAATSLDAHPVDISTLVKL